MSIKLEAGKKYVNTKNQLVRIVAEYNSETFGKCFIGVVKVSPEFEQPQIFLENGCATGFTSNIHTEYDEYAEWKNLPVDSKILVQVYGPRYFHSFDSESGLVYFYPDGKTSWSARAYNEKLFAKVAKVENCTIVKD